MSRKSKKYILLIVFLFLLLPALLGGNSPQKTNADQPKIAQQAHRNKMNRLWENHGNWTRLFITSTLDELEYQDPTRKHLLENQRNIGEALKLFYGDEAGEQFTALLEVHVQIAGEMLQAAKSADASAFEDTVDRWYANADRISEFLHELNPEHWPRNETRTIFRAYLDLTLELAIARWSGDLAADVAATDKMRTQAHTIADMFSDGMISQFPERFK